MMLYTSMSVHCKFLPNQMHRLSSSRHYKRPFDWRLGGGLKVFVFFWRPQTRADAWPPLMWKTAFAGFRGEVLTAPILPFSLDGWASSDKSFPFLFAKKRTRFCGLKAFTSTLPFPAPELFPSSRGALGALPYLIFRIVVRWQGSHFTRFPSWGACSWRTREVDFNQAEGIKLGCLFLFLNWGLRVEVHLWFRSVFICGSALNTRAHRYVTCRLA